MKKLSLLLLLAYLPVFSYSQNQLLDKVVAVVGGKELITFLEVQKRKALFLSKITNLSASNDISQPLDKEITEKIVIEKMVFLIGKERNIIVPDDSKLVSSIIDDKIREEVLKEKTFYSDYVSEIKQQYIISRLITSDNELKKLLDSDPTEREIEEIINPLYEKNKPNLKTVKVSFIMITVFLPNNLSLREEKEIEETFRKISNLVEAKNYEQAVKLAEDRLGKYLVREATRFIGEPTSIQSLVKEGFSAEFLGPIVNVKVGQVLPYPIKGIKIKDKDYAFALKVLSREETVLTKDEFKQMVLNDPSFKQQVTMKISDDRLKRWIISTFRGYGYDVKFLDKTYEIEIQ